MKRRVIDIAVVSALLALLAGPAWGQYQVRQGQVLDANQRVGSGGLNQPRAAYDFNRGNQIMSGNAAGGMSFRGYSPIRDPGSFYMTPTAPQGSGLLSSSTTGLGYGGGSYLPSDTLNNFRRDSYSAGYPSGSYTPYGAITPYYSSSTALSTGSVIAGQNRIEHSLVQNPYQSPANPLAARRTDLLSSVQDSSAGGRLLAVPSRVVRASNGQPVAGNLDYRLMSNPLFVGAFREVSAPEIASQAQAGQGAGQAGQGQEVSMAEAKPLQMRGPVDLRVRSGLQDQRVVSDRIPGRGAEAADNVNLQAVLARAAEDGDYAPGQTSLASRTKLLGPKPDENQPISVQPGIGGGGEVGDFYAWMQRKAEVRAMGVSPGVLSSAGPPSGEEETGPFAKSVGGAALSQVLASRSPDELSLQTFVGTESTALNEQLKYAEEAMHGGRYYRAAEAYSLARSVAPDNPLPVLGQCMALLGAGDYITSVSNLFEAIRLFNSLGEFELDLKSFLPDLKVLDSRRADLERRLAMRDNGRLRFLLGFAEYNSGLKPAGVRNMENGMLLLNSQDADMTAVRRYVQTLRSKVGGARPVDAPSPK